MSNMRNNYMYPNNDYSQNHMKNPNGQWGNPIPNVGGYMNADFQHPMMPAPYMEGPPMLNEAYPPNSKLNQYVGAGNAWEDNGPGKIENDDGSAPTFTFNKGAANVPMHLSGTEAPFENDFNKRNSGWQHKNNRNVPMNIPPANDNWSVGNTGIDHHGVQNAWARPMNVPMGGNHMNNVPMQGGWDNMKRPQNSGNYRGNKNNYMDNNMKQNMHHQYIPRNDMNYGRNNMNSGFGNNPNVMWSQNNNMTNQYVNPRMPMGHHDIPIPRQNTNPNMNQAHVNIGANQLPVQGGNRNISNQHENRNKHDNNPSMVLGNASNHSNIQTPTETPSNVFNATEDSYWRDPNGEMKKWQRDTGTAVWGDPEENNNSSIKRWMIPTIPDLLESDHILPGLEKENGVKVVVARGWGDENQSGMNSPQVKSNTSVASPLYNKNDNRWSPDSGKGNRLGMYGSGDDSDWEVEKSAHSFGFNKQQGHDLHSNNDHTVPTGQPSQDLIKIALSKKYIDHNMLNRQMDQQYNKQLNNLFALIQQACFLESQLDNFRRVNESSFAANENPEVQSETKKSHNALIVEVARVKTEISSLRDSLKNQISGMPSPSNCELPPGSLLHSIKSEYNFSSANDDYLHDTLTTTNATFGMDSASAAVNRALANLDISGNETQSGNILASTVWNLS
uniref:Protein Gawky n=1 Tax=Parastrongyloides trichosuri TaxID=131310 RepID=A0A0N4ZE52_PARTI